MSEDQVLNEDITIEVYEDEMEVRTNNDDSSKGAKKRHREEEQDDDWISVQNRKERRREERGLVEIRVTSKEPFPKQFALAKLFKNQNICDIHRVKYVNPYKIIVEVNGERSAELLSTCEHLLEMGWRFQRPLEVGLSYGVIKHIELDLSEDELLKSITGVTEVVNVKRLKRRHHEGEGGWVNCESVRVGFRGSSLPSYVFIYDLKVNVEPYVFPVTQCSRCWRFGHTIKMCPSKRVFCPKCGGKHDNCSSNIYKCINCTKNHMSLSRDCPVYIKERKIRNIMAEFNVSYRKAVTMYVPLPPTDSELERSPERTQLSSSPAIAITQDLTSEITTQKKLTYAQAASSAPLTIERNNKKRENSDVQGRKQKKKKGKKTETEDFQEYKMSTDSEEDVCENSENEQSKKKRRGTEGYVPFFMLLKQLKNIFCRSNMSWEDKIIKIIQLCGEWIITLILENMSNLPLLQGIFNNYG